MASAADYGYAVELSTAGMQFSGGTNKSYFLTCNVSH